MRKAWERSEARTSRARRATAWSVLGAFLGTLPGAPAAIAAPQGERVVKGKATFERDGADTHITTQTKETIVDYDRFDVGSGESVRIDQPTSRSRILNRVPRGDESRIDGSLSSNGIVYILNPAGVFLGDHAVVSVGGLVAGAGSLSNKDFSRGVDRITDVQGDVGVAEGARVQSTGDVLLAGRHVENLGEIASERGMIALVAGQNVMLTRHGSHLLLDVDAPAESAGDPNFALTQAGTLEAKSVTLSAGDSYSLAMNHTGITRAGEIDVQAGREAEVELAGTLDASNAAVGKTGGSIHVEGGKIDVQDATLDASGAAGGGEILVGGDLHGGGTMPVAHDVEVGADATLRADATAAGNGGKIIVYADEQTRFYGAVSARGGPQGGDGGFAEISGMVLTAAGHVDLGAAQGQSGTVLYDPDKIVIVGGSGTDTNDPTVSQMYESSLESTNADVVISATNRIETAGTFTNQAAGEGPGIVVIMPGHSLTLRTTATSAPLSAGPDDFGIDLTKSSEGDTLTWRVSQGGNITIQTAFDTVDPAPSFQPPIKVGKLESNSAAFQTTTTASVDTPVSADRTITISAKRGDISVRQITANGDDATPAQPAEGNNPARAARSASGAASITVTSSEGNVTIGNGSDAFAIQAHGGSGTPSAHSLGAKGASVTIGTEGGNLDVLGAIDAHGGDGVGSFTITNPTTGQSGQASGGGAGGAIALAATTSSTDPAVDQGHLRVMADLDARGGNGHAVRNDDGTVEDATGNFGGAIALSATRTIDVGAAGARVTFDASGGDGTSSGGSARGSNASLTPDVPGAALTEAFRISGPVADNGSVGVTEDDVTIHADLIARGGNARSGALAEDGIAFSELAGGDGGHGGDASVQAHSFLASDMLLDMSGGAGSAAPVRGGVDPPRGADGKALLLGGNGGTLSIGAEATIELGGTASDPEACCGVISRGGDATNGGAGDGGIVTATGGDVAPTGAPDPTHWIIAGDMDVSGGNASLENPTSKVPLDGGAGGSITLTSNEEDVGRVLLRGRLGGEGGTGIDTDGNTTHGQGATVTLTAVSAIQVDGSVLNPDGSVPAGVVVGGGNLTLGAKYIGTGTNDDGTPTGVDAPIPIAGTAVTGAEGSDLATITGNAPDTTANAGRIAVELRRENGLPTNGTDATGQEGLETLVVVMHDPASTALVTRDDSGGDTMVLQSVGATATTPHTLESLQTNDGDPFVEYRLDVSVDTTTGATQPDLAIARDAIDVGIVGARVANGGTNPDATTGVAPNRGAIVAVGAGTDPHATTAGTLNFEGSSIGTATDPIEVAGVTHDQPGATNPIRPILRFDAQGEIQAKVAQSTPVSDLEIVQFDAGSGAHVDLGGGDGIQIDSASADSRVPISRITSAVTTASGTGFSYRLEAKAPDKSVNEAALQVDHVDLGGTGLLSAPGDVLLRDTGSGSPAIQTNGHALSISSTSGGIQQEGTGISIDMSGGTGTERDLVLTTNGDIGTVGTNGAPDQPIRTRGVHRLAGQAALGDLVLVNDSAGTDGLRIEQLTPQDPALQDSGSSGSSVNGLLASGSNGSGNVRIENDDSRIVLGNVGAGGEFSVAQITAAAGVMLKAQSIEIENARYLKVATPLGPVFVPLNDARIAAGKDVVLDGPVQTSLGSVASSTDPAAPAPQFVNGKLKIESKGTTHFTGDVGGDGSDDQNELALLDTTDAAAEGAGTRTFRVGDAHFRGTLDGPAGVQVIAHDLSTSAPDHVAGATFDGNIGGHTPLASFDVQAEQLRFTTANQIVATGDITLDGNPTNTPQTVATIADTTGGLSIRSQNGTFRTGEQPVPGAVTNEKLSVQGPLEISAQHVSVEDVNAAQHLQINSPDIQIRARDPGTLLLKNGQTTTDGGTDLVADSISFSTLPTIDHGASTAPVLLGVGGGGVSAPGNLSDFEVRRFTPSVDRVVPGDMTGPSGVVLDLTATGNSIVGDPSEDVPRQRPLTDPYLPPRFSKQQPGPAPVVDAEQVLAYLRCGDAGGVGAGCDVADSEELAGVHDWQNSALATPRADQLAQSYRAMRAHKLSAVFDRAGTGFRQAQGFGEFDSAAFARYLESGAQPEARTAIHQLAYLLVEVDLLGLAPADEMHVRRELASQLATEADLEGFDTDAALQAVAATSIELPQRAANETRR